MKLSTKIILPLILISALLILLAGCFGVPTDESPGYTPGTTTINGIIAAPCCSTSSTAVSDAPSDWCLQCEQNWFLQKNIEVILTYEGEEIGSTTTNAQGEYTFTNLSAGENYVITAICPDDGGKPLVKDVVKEVADGEDYDAGITDCESTALGLIVDALVNLGISSEYIILEDILSAVQFVQFVEAVCEVMESCGDITSDENLLDLGNSVLMEVLGENPGWTGGEVICVWNPTCPSPTADAGGPYTATLVCEDGDGPDDSVTVTFSGSASGAGTFSYLWDFGDGNTSTEQNPTHTYASPTAAFYTVTLTVTGDGVNTCGSDTDATTVTINYVPCECGECYSFDLNDCFSVKSRASYDGTNTTFWFKICAISNCSGLSHWVYGTDTSAKFCIKDNDIVSITPTETSIGYDGSTGNFGIKWENSLPGDGECKEFTIVLKGCRVGDLGGDYMAILKYGNYWTTFDICGPTCD